jgi:thiol-disulfide isomerase/thioredoxin
MKKIAMILAGLIATVLMLSACSLLPALTVATDAPEAAAATEAATEPDAAEETESTLEFSLTTLTGDTLDQTIFTENKLIMVNYWATWCGPCVSEIPDLIKISEDYADKGFVLIGVLTGDDDIDGAKAFIEDQGVSYPVVLPEAFFLDYTEGMQAIPTTLFFNSQGEQISAAVVGSRSYDDWAGLIDLLLDQVS